MISGYKKIPVSKGAYWAIVDPEDYELVSKFKWHLGSGGYASKNSTMQSPYRTMHAMLAGTPKGMFTDHINGQRLDNRRSNLRVVSRTENPINRGKNLHSRSKYKGVAYDRRGNGRWFARITLNKKTYHIGMFDTEEEAARAYNAVAPAFHKEFARLNELNHN